MELWILIIVSVGMTVGGIALLRSSARPAESAGTQDVVTWIGKASVLSLGLTILVGSLDLMAQTQWMLPENTITFGTLMGLIAGLVVYVLLGIGHQPEPLMAIILGILACIISSGLFASDVLWWQIAIGTVLVTAMISVFASSIG